MKHGGEGGGISPSYMEALKQKLSTLRSWAGGEQGPSTDALGCKTGPALEDGISNPDPS